ncbi:MAG: hypothetical protein K0B08_02345 [Bacteroidales bacterium]|nr:hypothetical protein [Bacteroidales bacterium]
MLRLYSIITCILILSASADAGSLDFSYIPDTIQSASPDTMVPVAVVRRSSSALDAKVVYQAADTIRFAHESQKVYLIGNAHITYKDLDLKAAYIEIDLPGNELYASGLPDSTGKIVGDPVFTQGDQSFKAKVMRYNYKTEKGFINHVITEDGYGFLHGKRVKKVDEDIFNVSKGSYTTCNLEEHPHFEFRYNKSRIISKKRIVTGPAYLTIEEVPTPLLIPFGWFPNKQGQRSGILIPTFGEVQALGFSFENGGYYLYINDRMDARVVGDIYTGGSWAIRPTFRYKKRYKYTGEVNLNFATTITGVKETPGYTKRPNYAIRWSHRRDPKARPRSNFSADVNIVTSTYNRYNSTSAQDYLSNTFRSSIAYQTNFAGKYFLTLNASHDQNTLTHVVNVTFPEVSFSVNRFNPFSSSNRVGRTRWYHNITTNYNMNARNTLSTTDSLFFSEKSLREMKNGIRHTMPISSPIKLMKHLTWTNTLNLTDRMYFESYRKYWSNDTLFTGSEPVVGYLAKDTLQGFHNIFDFGFSSSLSTKVYGLLQFGPKFPVNAIRHVLTPTVSFSYNPDFSSDFWGYYDSYYDQNGQEIRYSKFEGALFGAPGSGTSGRVNVNLTNNLEMKVRSRKDTITGTRKVSLIDQFVVNLSYDFARDSLRWSPLSLSGRTRLFKNIDLTYRSEFDPYILDSTGTRNLNQTEWEVNRKLLRLKQTNWSVSMNWRLNSTDFGNKKEPPPRSSPQATEGELEEIRMNPDEYIDWSIPWDLTISYSFSYGVVHRYPYQEYERTDNIIQTLGLSGNVSITSKWKVGFATGWDFVSNDLSYTSISVYRDLHCWEMRFNWIPSGYRQSWNFSINAKASILQDMKLTKKKDFRDY